MSDDEQRRKRTIWYRAFQLLLQKIDYGADAGTASLSMKLRRLVEDFVGCGAALLLVASCGADVYREFHSAIAAFLIPLILIWLAGNWIIQQGGSNSPPKSF
jgi:hypothetical protein